MGISLMFSVNYDRRLGLQAIMGGLGSLRTIAETGGEVRWCAGLPFLFWRVDGVLTMAV
jgi:hypothetical protein